MSSSSEDKRTVMKFTGTPRTEGEDLFGNTFRFCRIGPKVFIEAKLNFSPYEEVPFKLGERQ